MWQDGCVVVWAQSAVRAWSPELCLLITLPPPRLLPVSGPLPPAGGRTFASARSPHFSQGVGRSADAAQCLTTGTMMAGGIPLGLATGFRGSERLYVAGVVGACLALAACGHAVPSVPGPPPAVSSASTPACTVAGQSIPAPLRSGALPGPLLVGITMRMNGIGWGTGDTVSGAEFTPAVWRTTDGGQKWVDVAPAAFNAGAMAGAAAIPSYVSAQTAWAAFTWDGSVVGKEPLVHIFRTTNGGACWSSTVLPGADAGEPISLDAVSATTAYLSEAVAPYTSATGKQPGRVLVTHDGGTTWSVVAQKPGKLPAVGTLTFTNATAGILTYQAPDVYRTADGGLSWQPVSLPADGCLGRPLQYPTFDAPTVFGTVGYAPVRDATTYGVVATSDGGQTWRWLSIPWCGPEDVSFANAKDGWVWAWSHEGTPQPVTGRFFHTTDGGLHWSTIPTDPTLHAICCGAGNGLSQIDFVSADTGWALVNTNTTANALLQTQDGGSTWTVVWKETPATPQTAETGGSG